MAPKLTWAQAVQHMAGNEDRLTTILKGDTSVSHPVFDLNLSIADGQMGSRIKTRYSIAQYDAWSSATIPSYVQFYLLCLLLGVATSHDDARSDLIKDYAGIAAGWLDDIESGAAKIAELQELGSGATGRHDGRVGTGEGNVFDRCRKGSAYGARSEKL